MGSQFFIGVDLGQAEDFTAIAVVERAEVEGAWDAARYTHEKRAELRLRHLERVPLGTAYPEVVERVRRVTGAAGRGGRCHLATGREWGVRWWTCSGRRGWGARCGR
jgi:hypothetical protein